MKKLYFTLLILSFLAFLGLTGYALVQSQFNFLNIIQPFLSLFNAPIQFTLATVEANNFTNIEVLALVSLMAIALSSGLISFISKLSKRKLMAGLTSLVLTLLSAYLIVAMIVPHFSVLNDGVGIGRYAYYLGDIISTGSFDSTLFNTILANGSLIPLLALDMLLLVALRSLLSKPSKIKVVAKVKTQKVVDTKKVVTMTPDTKVPPTQEALVTPMTTTPDATLSELVRLVMAEEVKALKGPAAYGSTSHQVDAALVRRIVAEELSRFQVHFISRAEVQTILAQEIALLKLSLNIK